MDQKKL